MEPEVRSQQVWWQNPRSTFDYWKQRGDNAPYFWCSKYLSDNRDVIHHRNIMELEIGDIVLHYVNGAIVAVSQVLERARASAKPYTDSWESRDAEGYRVSVRYFNLSTPIPRDKIPSQWRTPDVGPFTVKGDVKQGFLFPVSAEFAARFAECFHNQLPRELSP